MTDKLAEEILKEKGFFVMTHKEGSEHVRKAFIEPVIKAMQAYHEAANKAVTEADFEEWASVQDFGYGANYYIMKAGAKMGIKAMRDGEIKHNG